MPQHRPSTSRARRCAALLAPLALTAGCAGTPDAPPPPPVLDAQGALPEVPGERVYELEPAAFLEALTKTEGFWITLQHDAPAGWLSDADVRELEAQLGSATPCPHVVSARAVVLPMGGGTTEGEIARYMIAAARAGRFPIEMGSAEDDY